MEMFKFNPLLKSILWGGEKIVPFKHLTSDQKQVGESWEISGVKDNESVVSDGKYKGWTLNKLVDTLKDKLVGKENYERFGNEFPLLVKFIDAREQLSIQVHPTDEQAQAQGLGRGKTEMWYVMESDADASLRSGLKQQITPEQYKEMVENDTITRIHSIGAGCFLAEIQETSDVTYRIYDFKRKDKEGNYRELHTKEAAECIDYTVYPDYRTQYEARQNEPVELVSCPYFTTSVYDLTEPMTLDYSDLDSFVIFVGLKGEGEITDAEGNTISFRAGESVLLPATTTVVKVSGTIKFLESYV